MLCFVLFCSSVPSSFSWEWFENAVLCSTMKPPPQASWCSFFLVSVAIIMKCAQIAGDEALSLVKLLFVALFPAFAGGQCSIQYVP